MKTKTGWMIEQYGETGWQIASGPYTTRKAALLVAYEAEKETGIPHAVVKGAPQTVLARLAALGLMYRVV